MGRLAWYPSVGTEVEGLCTALRARCKAHLDRLRDLQPGVASGLRLEKVHKHITELKVSWNNQEFRFLFFGQLGVTYIVNFFPKKSRKTPPAEIELALRRRREIQLGTAQPITIQLH